MSRSTAAATKATTNQSTLTQIFKRNGNTNVPKAAPKPQPPALPEPQAPRTSVFDFKNRIQPPNPIQNVNVRSPSLFSSPSQKTSSPIAPAEKLYATIDAIDSPEFDDLLLQLDYNQNDKENSEPISPPLIQTQIQSKINAERHRQGNAVANGFISAKAICKKDIPAAAAVAPAQTDQFVSMQVVDKSATKNLNDKPAPKMVSNSIVASQCGFDDDALNMAFDWHDDEFDISPPSSTTAPSTFVGLAKANFRKPSNDDSVLKVLNLNVNCSKSDKGIVKDFEDDTGDSSDGDHPQGANFKLSEDALAFFSANDSRSNSDTWATVNTSPPPLPLPTPPSNNNGVFSSALQNIINRLPTASSNRQNHTRTNINGNTMNLNRFTNISSQTEQQQQTVSSKRAATTAPTLNGFRYVPPNQMPSNVDLPQQQQQTQQQKMDFFAPDPVERKRRKISIEDILGSTGNKYSEILAK